MNDHKPEAAELTDALGTGAPTKTAVVKLSDKVTVYGATTTAPSPCAGNIVDEVARFIERFVFIKNRSMYHLLALWTLQTHMYAEFDYTGYILACSPEPQSGKSRLLEVLELLVAFPSGIIVSPTEAVVFRTAQGHTQLFDEVDAWTNKDFLRSVLNAGFQRRGTVKRMRDRNGGYEAESFPVYAPRILAGIGTSILDATTLDRTFVIEMVRQTAAEKRERFRSRMVGRKQKSLNPRSPTGSKNTSSKSRTCI